MPPNFHDLIASPERRRAQQLAYSVEMVGDIASQYDTALEQREYAFARCMLDAFYVHVRLLADFLVKATKGKDFGPADFDVEWTTPTSQEATRLIEHWDAAGKYVVHLGRPRVPENLEDLEAFQVGGEHFQAMAVDALTVFRQFLTALESRTPAWHEGARIPDRQSEPQAWRARNLFDRTALVRSAFESACAKVGLDLVDG